MDFLIIILVIGNILFMGLNIVFFYFCRKYMDIAVKELSLSIDAFKEIIKDKEKKIGISRN